jgi:hypothetical protein
MELIRGHDQAPCLPHGLVAPSCERQLPVLLTVAAAVGSDGGAVGPASPPEREGSGDDCRLNR